MATVYTIMAYGGIALAVICLIIAVILFIKWDIPKVFGDITGRNEKKTVARIRKEGYEANASKKTAIKASDETGQIRIRKTDTDSLTKTSRMTSESTTASKKREENVTNTVFQVYEQETFDPAENTTVLNSTEIDSYEETTLLSDDEIAVGEETSVLSDAIVGNEEETSVLSGTIAESEAETSVLSGTAAESEAETSILSGTAAESEAETSVLSGSMQEETETTVLNSDEAGGRDMHPSEEETTVLARGNVVDVIQLPMETITPPGTVSKVLDFIVTHTDEVIS